MIVDSKLRKKTPLYFGLMVYFPDALEAVAQVSYEADRKHNPNKPEGAPPHWNRSTSTDEYDAVARHLNDRAKGVEFDPELSELAGRNIRVMACAAWRTLAALQKEIEAARELDRPRSEA